MVLRLFLILQQVVAELELHQLIPLNIIKLRNNLFRNYAFLTLDR